LLSSGYNTGIDSHSLYFTAKGTTPAERDAWIAAHRVEYCVFGIVIFALGLVPVVGMLAHGFGTVVSAVWAAQIEAANSDTDEASQHVGNETKNNHTVSDHRKDKLQKMEVASSEENSGRRSTGTTDRVFEE
jgi:hypothetical protein